jgi:hypothetical protein
MNIDDARIVSLRDTAWYLTKYAEEVRAGEFSLRFRLADALENFAEGILDVATDVVYGRMGDDIRLTPERMFGDDDNDNEAENDCDDAQPAERQQDNTRPAPTEEAQACKLLLRRYVIAFGQDGFDHLRALAQGFGVGHFTSLSPEQYPAVMQFAIDDAAAHGKTLDTLGTPA